MSIAKNEHYDVFYSSIPLRKTVFFLCLCTVGFKNAYSPLKESANGSLFGVEIQAKNDAIFLSLIITGNEN